MKRFRNLTPKQLEMNKTECRKRLAELTDEQIIDCLPHGSGIDRSWSITRQANGNIACYNSYHGMNEHGYYDGWQDFSIRIFPIGTSNDAPCHVDFKIVFHGYRQRKQWVWGLRDYLEDSIYHCLQLLPINYYECKHGLRFTRGVDNNCPTCINEMADDHYAT